MEVCMARCQSRHRRVSIVLLLLACFNFALRSMSSAENKVDRGRELFAQNCALCHGAFAQGGVGPDLTNPAWQATITDAEFGQVIQEGLPGTAMPSFAAKLSAPDRTELVRYLRTLSAQAVQPTTEAK